MTFKEHDDPERFLRRLTGRIEQSCERIKAGELDKTLAAFDILTAIFSAYEGGVNAGDLKRAFPITAWREDTVEVPRALLRPIAEAWRVYRDGQEPFGVAMGIEPRGKGHKPARSRARTVDREQRLSNEVVHDLIKSEQEGLKLSQDAAIAGVSERENVPYQTVRAAFRKRGKATMKKLGVGG